MILFGPQLYDRYRDFANPGAKIEREISAGHLFRLKRGIYCDSPGDDPFLIANALIRPSYVSFLSALSYHQMIPEGLSEVQSATAKIRKGKTFSTPLGRYVYHDVPFAAFPYGILTTSDGVLIACPEKAIADMVNSLSPVSSKKAMRALLFENLRIDEDLFRQLDRQGLRIIAPLYKSKNVSLLLRVYEDIICKTN